MSLSGGLVSPGVQAYISGPFGPSVVIEYVMALSQSGTSNLLMPQPGGLRYSAGMLLIRVGPGCRDGSRNNLELHLHRRVVDAVGVEFGSLLCAAVDLCVAYRSEASERRSELLRVDRAGIEILTSDASEIALGSRDGRIGIADLVRQGRCHVVLLVSSRGTPARSAVRCGRGTTSVSRPVIAPAPLRRIPRPAPVPRSPWH